MKNSLGRGNLLTRAAEGVSLAFDAVRASKLRAALTILGIAIGVMVVIAMASMITGIQKSVSDIVLQAGPKCDICQHCQRPAVRLGMLDQTLREVRREIDVKVRNGRWREVVESQKTPA